ncbi:hypothetical protein FMUND_15067 [Fusarium mundagurra]|uniref:Uncharacterized protein n=1 Tax=Fusarium mundagurra TaxID=1567541 RepID=A0A8H5XR19_9HYPO|nr:hypothetical protein FMUND_15067 [Fusarium mundagurra]
MSFYPYYEVYYPFTAECSKQYVLNGNLVEESADQNETPDEKKSSDTRSLKSQSTEVKDSESNNQDTKFQPRDDENKTTRSSSDRRQPTTEPPRQTEKMESRKTQDDGDHEHGEVCTGGLSIRLKFCCMYYELDYC